MLCGLFTESVQPLVGLPGSLVQLLPGLVQLGSGLLLRPLGLVLSVPRSLLSGSRELLTLLLSLLGGVVGGDFGVLTDGLGVSLGVVDGDGTGSIRDGLADASLVGEDGGFTDGGLVEVGQDVLRERESSEVVEW